MAFGRTTSIVYLLTYLLTVELSNGHNNTMTRVSVKRRHSVFDAQNFGQNAQKRKTVRQVTQRIFR